MSTSDNLPPHEAKGALGQVSSGGGLSPLSAAAPVPNAAASSPGLATNAAAPIAGLMLPDADPAGLALLVSRMANELFGAPLGVGAVTGLAPLTTPSPTAAAITPASPGYSPTLGEGAPTPPTAPTAPALPTSFDVAPVFPTDGFGFGSGQPAAIPFSEVMRLPVVDAVPEERAYFVPPEGAPGLEAPLATDGFGLVPSAHEPVSSSLVRDLGGNAFDPHAVRREFPILEERVHGKRLVWLDNAATTQKPRAVIDRLSYFYEHENSNVHRAAHTLAARATDAYEAARETVRRFLNAPSSKEIVWVRGATEGVNLVAKAWGGRHVKEGDEILVTHLEHHANIVPWQQLCADKGARLRVAPVDDRGQIILEEYEKLLGPKTRLVAFTQVSNALGTITPAKEMIEIAHRYGARVLLDGAQAVSHMPVDVQALDCDFFVFSGHKVFGPTGIGVVYGKPEVLAEMPPWQGGGNMIQDVTFERTVYHPPPWRFEAGTGNIADAVGLGAALDWLTRLGLPNVARYEHDLLVYGTERLKQVPGLTMIGTAPDKAGVLSFVLDGQRTEDVGAALDKEGIAVRSGHHCAQPILRRFGVEATVRASLAPYNVCADLDALVDALLRLQARRG